MDGGKGKEKRWVKNLKNDVENGEVWTVKNEEKADKDTQFPDGTRTRACTQLHIRMMWINAS